MSYTMVDLVVLIVLVVSTLLAFSRGFVREALSLLGWIVALIVSAKFAYLVVPMIEGLPVIKDYAAQSCELLTVVAFVILFILTMVVMALLTPFLSGMVQNSALGMIDKGLGGVFGILRGVVIILLLVLIYDNFVATSTPVEIVENSRSYEIFNGPKKSVENQLPSQDAAPNWFAKQFDAVTSHCEGRQPNV